MQNCKSSQIPKMINNLSAFKNISHKSFKMSKGLATLLPIGDRVGDRGSFSLISSLDSYDSENSNLLYIDNRLNLANARQIITKNHF